MPQHLKVQSGYKKQIYTSYHYAYDDFYAPASEKQRLYDELKNLGYDATINIIENESQLDGKFIKTLTHGLDMSIKTLISKELPPMLAKITARPKQPCEDKSISYVSDDLEYKFFEANDKTYEIPSCDDVELGVKRDSLLEFKLSYDDEKPVRALVFIVPGLGGDANENYREHLAQFVASEFDVAVASVNYHCIGNRPQTGATYFLNDSDKIILKKKCSKIGIEIPSDISYDALSTLDAYLGNIKSSGGLPSDFKLEISVTLQPTKNEYQNFGIMQAQDVINAALFIKANPSFKHATDINELPVVLVGSSHGAYINALAAKFAPWLVGGLIDNSSYAKLNWELIGLGKEAD